MMEIMHYIGLDIHKKVIAFCIKRSDGSECANGLIPATRSALSEWIHELPNPWTVAMEATMFTGWIYDFLRPHASNIKVAHPEMLKAITASKKKNDQSDAERICDLLRVDLLPECYMAPTELRELRRLLRYRTHIIRTSTRVKNKIAGILMEFGSEYTKSKLHGTRYFSTLLETVEYVPESAINLLQLSREQLVTLNSIQKMLVRTLKRNPLIRDRMERLMTIQGVGEITALTWILEIGEPERFGSIRQAVSYCGLCSAQKESAGKSFRSPLSKKRNKHIQSMLIEAAKLAPRYNPRLAEIYDREIIKGNRNRGTLAVARKLVAYMLSVERSRQNFQLIASDKAA